MPRRRNRRQPGRRNLEHAGQEFVELFLTEASEHLQFLREYSGILMDPYPMPEDVERLYISAHTLEGTSASYGYPLFSESLRKACPHLSIRDERDDRTRSVGSAGRVHL